MTIKVNKQVEDFTRGLLDDALAHCSSEQQAFFHRLYPNGVPEDRLVSAIDLCHRTIKKNEETP